MNALRWLVPSFLLFEVAQAADITATGSWTETIDAADLTGGAGSNLTTQYDSSTSATTLGITIGAAVNWRVDVRRSDVNWHGNFVLSLKRTSDGSGLGSISGGTAFQTITTGNAAFFSGSLNRSNISVQYRLSGMSVAVTPASYSTTVTFTVVEL